MTDTYGRTARTCANRDRGRMHYDRTAIHAVLDEAYFCHLAFVVDGDPRVLPTLHVRIDEAIYVHGSTGSRPLLAARAPGGLAVCLAVTLLDGLIFARSQAHHSAQFRSVVVHGTARLVTDEAGKRRVLTALLDKLGPGRAAESRPPTRKELAETAVLAVPLGEASLRVRPGVVMDEPADLALPHWAGVVPLRLSPGPPVPAPGVTTPPPAYLPT
jgi:nitroimidazol reductase NimA-like FMN-containing flavoprotein (pyridoxamine 5'-phosphate oxidase superfamily)